MHNILSGAQHEFRRGFSTTQLTAPVHDFAGAVDRSGQIDAIFLGYSKAFDQLLHDKLLFKLKQIGSHSKIMRWIKAYLKSSRQFVDANKNDSGFLEVNPGVFQGSVLAPLLFIIYIDDLIKYAGANVPLRLFADDCVIFSEVSSIEDQATLNRRLNQLAEWCDKWDMVINYDKTVYLRITNKRNHLPFIYNIANNLMKSQS